MKRSKLFTKGFIIGLIITFIVSLLLAAALFGVGVLVTQAEGHEWDANLLVNFVDAFSLSGLLGILIYLMAWVASKGAFDMIAYSVKLFWYNTFHKSTKDTNLPGTYQEYVELKHGQEKESNLYLLLGSLPTLLIGLILFIIYLVKVG
ncbi:MAG: DUF3899 domain-containing protein [Bacilli bacterium]|nr:DUF3899 domain-containing protein [Bacilli bacterium]